MTQPDEIEALAAAILATLTRVHDQILTELRELTDAWPGQSRPSRVRRLRAVEAAVAEILATADTQAASQVLTATQRAYETGAWVTAIVTGGTPTFGGIDTDTITAVARDTMDDLLHATQHVAQEVKDVLRVLAKDRVAAKVTTGQTALQAARDLVAAMSERGITGVVYANGARVPMTVYAEMLLRTKTAEAYQLGGLNQGATLGIEHWQIMDGPGCGLTGHGVGPDANGMIVTAEVAAAHLLAHPNCRRSTSPRPDLAAPDPMGDPVQVWAEAVRRQQATTGPFSPSTAPGVVPGIDTGAGILPNTGAARRHAATLRRHG